MAVSAKFVADFQSFDRAVTTSVAKLRTFETGAAGVERGLNRMADSFSGRRLIQEATLAAKAVEDLGGTSRLSRAELERVSTMAGAAAEKLRLLGQDVPERLQRLATAAQDVAPKLSLTERAASALQSTLGQVAAGVGLGNLLTSAASGLANWTRQAIAASGAIADVADRTGFSVEAIQRMQFVAAATGTRLEQFEKAAFQLQVRVGRGRDSVVGAVDALGLSLDALRARNADDQFDAIVRALSNVADPVQRNTLAFQLFGEKALEILPAIAQGYDDIASRAVVAGEAQVRAVDAAVDRWDEFVANTTTNVLGALGSILTAWDTITEVQTRSLSIQFMSDEQRAQLEQQRQGLEQGAVAQAEAGAAALSYAEQLRVAEAALAGLTTAQKSEIAAAQAIGASLSEMADALGVSEVALRLYAQQQRAADQATRSHVQASRLLTREQEQLAEALKTSELDAFTANRNAAVPAITDMGDAIRDRLIPELTTFDAAAARAGLTVEGFLQTLAKAPQAIAASGASTSRGLFGGLIDSITSGITGGNGAAGLLSGIGAGITQGIGNLLSGGLSSLIGRGVGLLGQGVSSLFGALTNREGRQTNDLRDEFVASAGGLDALNQQAHEAGLTLDRLLAADKVREFRAAVDELNMAWATQAETAAFLESTMAKYNITVAELGGTERSERMSQGIADLRQEWDALFTAGVDTLTIADRMGDAILEWVEAAQRAGLAIPAELQQMLDAVNQVKAEIGKPVNVPVTFAFLNGGLSGNDLLSPWNFASFADWSANWLSRNPGDENRIQEALGEDAAAFPGFARGTGGRFLDFGAGTPAMLHGRERVVTESEGRAEAAGWQSLATQLAGLRGDMTRLVSEIAAQTRAGVAIQIGQGATYFG